MGLKDAATAMRIPDHFSAWVAASREEPTPLRWPETMISKLPARSASGGNRRSPPTVIPAYAFRAMSSGR
jgi:hypothetical protein